MATGPQQPVAPVGESRLVELFVDELHQKTSGLFNTFRQLQNISGDQPEQGLSHWIGLATTPKKTVCCPRNHQSWTPCHHGYFRTLTMNLLGHQQIAELAVLVGLISIERAYAVHHGGPWPLVNALHCAESCRLANPSTSSRRVVNLRGGDDDGSGALT